MQVFLTIFLHSMYGLLLKCDIIIFYSGNSSGCRIFFKSSVFNNFQRIDVDYCLFQNLSELSGFSRISPDFPGFFLDFLDFSEFPTLFVICFQTSKYFIQKCYDDLPVFPGYLNFLKISKSDFIQYIMFFLCVIVTFLGFQI